jgi:2-dehydro-3-deoxy-L-rhamnonate dehydrogenase (NAD+)
MTWELPLDEWRCVLEVNLTGAFLCCKAVIPQMLQQCYGRIVNISSISGKEGNAEIVAYAASEAEVISLTKTLGKELARTEIRINCVTPAAIRTSIFDQCPRTMSNPWLRRSRSAVSDVQRNSHPSSPGLPSLSASFSAGAVFDLSGGRATC